MVRRRSVAVVIWTELLAWSVVARLLVARVSLARTLRVLDMMPARRGRGAKPVPFPTDRQVCLAGACLGRSLARSQYFRRRGVPHRVVIGVTGGTENFRAHAWVAPYEEAPEDFIQLRSIER